MQGTFAGVGEEADDIAMEDLEKMGSVIDLVGLLGLTELWCEETIGNKVFYAPVTHAWSERLSFSLN